MSAKQFGTGHLQLAKSELLAALKNQRYYPFATFMLTRLEIRLHEWCAASANYQTFVEVYGSSATTSLRSSLGAHFMPVCTVGGT